MMMHACRTTFAAASLAAVLCASTGCTMFQEQISPKLTAEVVPGEEAASGAGESKSTFTVEARPAEGKPIAKEQPLARPITVQEAIEKTRVNKQFRRFTLDLLRPLPDGRMHRMSLEYDRSNKRVPPEFDYTILAGDRLIVTEDPSTVIDDILSKVTEPLGGANAVIGRTKSGGRYRMEG